MKKYEQMKVSEELKNQMSIEELRELRTFLRNRMDAAEMRSDMESYEIYAAQFDEVTAAIKAKRAELGWC